MVTKSVTRGSLALILMSSLLFGCSMDQSELKKERGTGLAYSEYFKGYDGLDEREDVTYYKPVQLDEADTSLPEVVRSRVHELNPDKLPFNVDEEKAYLVTSKDKDGKLRNQVQISYIGKDEYEQPEAFLIISITDSDKDPLASFAGTDKVDTVGNEFKKEQLTEDVPIYQQILTTDSALIYKYYEETEKGIATVGTSANEFYTYYKGHIYHIGYWIDRDKKDENMQETMLQLVREYILSPHE
ncbi:hypothetical protein DVB69_15550 [Sporosarcina sp. BI001-red]|uniref:hypothetical protein n=1 Tax=Sporosarcina sp. BI001-red TaxID=2282866 RepID=UPI000E2343E7|nr:hypothetical protein [Sporosarcina sp. BI001-red]REB05178.1 hypothetical protein DVB69_15550 [Sporosarcina sp. BI001-red]